MRAHERRGITRADVQGRINRTYLAGLKHNERGWPIPYTPADAANALEQARRNRYYEIIVLKCGRYRRSEALRYWRALLDQARHCNGPRLP